MRPAWRGPSTVSPGPSERPGGYEPTSLIFSFIGGINGLARVGRGFYREDEAFRASVDAMDRVVQDQLGFSPASLLRGGEPPDSFVGRRQAAIIHSGVFACSLFDKWRDAGVTPEAVIGLSIGEVSAAYGAAVLTREDAALVLCAIAEALTHEVVDDAYLMVEAPFHEAERLCALAPAPLLFAGAALPGMASLYSPMSAYEANRAFLERETKIVRVDRTDWRYHTSPELLDGELLARRLSDLRPQPADAVVYSAALGGPTPEGMSFGPAYWSQVAAAPIRYDEAVRAAYDRGFNTVITLGPYPIGRWMNETAEILGRDVRMIDSLVPGRPEPEGWAEMRETVRALTGR